MKINLKKYIGIFVSCSQLMHVAMPLKVYAKTVKIAEEEQREKQKINSKISSLNAESKAQNENQKQLKKQILDTESRINNLEKEREKLKEQNKQYDGTIDKSVFEMENIKKTIYAINNNVENLENDSKNLEENVKYIVLENYTDNSNNFNNNMNLLMNADNINDFTKNVEYTKKCTDYSNNVITSYSDNIKNLETQKNLKIQHFNELSRKVQDIDNKIIESNKTISRISSLNEELSKNVENLNKMLNETELRSKFIEESKKKCEAMQKKIEEENKKEDPTSAIMQIINNKEQAASKTKQEKNNNSKEEKIKDKKGKQKEGKLNKKENEKNENQNGKQSFVCPLKGKYKFERGFVPGGHKGADLSTFNEKISIYSAKDGKVIHIGNNKTKGFRGYGNHILIEHYDKDGKPLFTTLYAHCDTTLVTVGQKVTVNTQIAKVGKTGDAQGIHLHFEIRFKGKPINPAKYIKF